MGNSVVYAIKIALTVAATLAVVLAINTLIGAITTFGSNNPFSEVIILISLFLPFSPASVFGSLLLSMGAILACIIANKVYHLTIKAQEAA